MALTDSSTAGNPYAAAIEHTAGKDTAATEHTGEPQLVELVNQEAGLTTNIELKVTRSQIMDYQYPWQGKQISTQKLQIILQSKIPEQYCLGVAKLQKKDHAELRQMAQRWQTGSTWRFPHPLVTCSSIGTRNLVPVES